MIQALRKKSQWVTSLSFLLLLSLIIYINSPFWKPFLIAGIFSMGLDNYITRITLKWNTPRWVTIVIVLLCGFLLFWAPLTLATYRLVNIFHLPESINSSQIPDQLNNLKVYTIEIVRKFSVITGADITQPVQEALETLVKKIGEYIIAFSSGVIRSAPSIFFNALLFSIFFITLTLNSEKFRQITLKYSFFNEPVTEKIIENLKSSCSITLFSTFIIGLVQAGIVILGSLIFDEGDFWLIMPITFVVAFIPVIGAGPVGFLLSLLAFIGGRTGSAIGMFVVSLIASTIDNVLKPLLLGGNQLKLSPVLTFTCVVGSILTLGISGFLIGPIILNIYIRIVPILIVEFNSSKLTD
jgi:predicted PurR-regulated permease PerM